MKRSVLAFLAAFVLVFSSLVPAAIADGTGSRIKNMLTTIQSVVSEGKKLSGKLEIGKNIRKILTFLEERSKNGDVDIDKLLIKILGKATDDKGKVDGAALIGLVGSIFGSENKTETDEITDEDIQNSPYIKALNARDDAILAHLSEKYKDAMEAGDVQIASNIIPSNDEEDLKITLGQYCLMNYAVDGKDLKRVNSASCVEYLTFVMNEDGSFTVTEAIEAEEGDAFEASVAALCEKYGITTERFYGALAQMDYYESSDLAMYLKEHPEYERIEYKGEMRTLEEMMKIMEDELGKIFEAVDFSDFGE